MNKVCYLCGRSVQEDAESRDHAVPKNLIERDQPIVKGFDYGGVLPTHAECNNRFGPETYTARALDLLAVLNDEKSFVTVQNRHDPSVVMMALNSALLPEFTKRDLRYFKIIDVREKEEEEWSQPAFFSGKERADPRREARNIALAVLAKSASALLIKRHLLAVPKTWCIVAAPYTGATEFHDFDSLLGSTQPFDVGVKVWIRKIETGDWFAVYKARNVIIFFTFMCSGYDLIPKLRSTFKGTDLLKFDGQSINELLTNPWKKV